MVTVYMCDIYVRNMLLTSTSILETIQCTYRFNSVWESGFVSHDNEKQHVLYTQLTNILLLRYVTELCINHYFNSIKGTTCF